MDNNEELIAALMPVSDSFRRLGIAFYVGGSVASSYHGAIRSTMDVDLVCELTESHVQPLIEMLGTGYYASETAIREAIRRKSCFNLIHLATSFKVDVFVSRRRPFDIESMRRSTICRLGEADTIEVPIATAEDSIISKLEWYRLTDETSERQWSDVCRLRDLWKGRLDVAYLKSAATSVGVVDLLERLFGSHSF